MSAIAAIIARDVRLAVRAGGGASHAVAFFALVALASAFAIGPDLPLLARMAPAVIWVGAVLAALLSLDRMFQADFEDGDLDILVTADAPLEGVVIAKSIAHWLTTGLPLILVAPVIGVLMNLDGASFAPMIVALAVGTPGLSLIGAIGAALTASLRRGGLIISLLVAPLYTPFLIFGVAAAMTARDGAPLLGPELGFLAASTLFAFAVSPLASAAALRANLS